MTKHKKTVIAKTKSLREAPKTEEGMTIVIALLMGLVLLAGATGLMMRQLIARKLGASESYQQMAESAALNGLNRILSDLNLDNRNQYTGFLLSLNNDQGKRGWATPNSEGFQLVELCTPTTKHINAYPVGTESESPRIIINSGTMRSDGISNSQGNQKPIQIGYRLRSYNTTANNGNGEGTFYVEGIVQRGTFVLARALLKRSLYISSNVAGAGDWAVMSGHNLRMNNTTITGPGNIFYLTNLPDAYSAQQYASSCSDNALLENVSATNSNLAGKDRSNQVWPININEAKRGVSGMPPIKLFKKDPINDTTQTSDGETIRMWSFDDSAPAPDDRNQDGINDLETDGITEKLYSALPCAEVICVRDADKTNASDFRTLNEELGSNQAIGGSTITLSTDILCKNSDKFDCHVYIDHINLSQTKLHIQTTDTRSVVLHLEQPKAYPNDLNLSRAIKLDGTSELCGVNNTDSVCNENPEQLVIVGTTGSAPTEACNTLARSVSFKDNNLPYALLYLPTGTIRPDNATLSGLAWASSICVLDDSGQASNFTLNTETNNTPIVQRANDNWGWLSRFNYPGYGRMVTRAIRGTSLDTFERW